jgi:hypothetical protein
LAVIQADENKVKLLASYQKAIESAHEASYPTALVAGKDSPQNDGRTNWQEILMHQAQGMTHSVVLASSNKAVSNIMKNVLKAKKAIMARSSFQSDAAMAWSGVSFLMKVMLSRPRTSLADQVTR